MYRFVRYSQPAGPSLFSALANRSVRPSRETETERLFGAALADFATPAYTPRIPIDLYEDKDNTFVRAALPGVSREAISLEVVDGQLTLGVRQPDDEKSFLVTRAIAIPESVQADKVSAAYENGVLTVTLPKPEQAKPRKITIAVN